MTDIPQGDLRLLETDTAKRLLASAIPARMAYMHTDGSPRMVASWHLWTGYELVMCTYIFCAPLGIMRPSRRLSALRANPRVAVSIDTEPQPPEVLQLRGDVSITELHGVVPEQVEAARRFLGEEGGTGYASLADQPDTRMARIALRPSWVGLLDFRTRFPGA